MVIVNPNLNRRLRRAMEAGIQKARPEMEARAEELVALMQSIAPVRAVGGGTGRESIGWMWGRLPRRAQKLGESEEDRAHDLITVYAAGKVGGNSPLYGDRDAFYMRFQEFGTVNHAAQPFFWPSYRALRRKIRAGMSRAVRQGIRDSQK